MTFRDTDTSQVVRGYLNLSEVVHYSQSDRWSYTSTGDRFDMASLNGLRDSDARTHQKSLTFISTVPCNNPLVTQRVMAFLDRCYADDHEANYSDYAAREKAMGILRRAKSCDSVPFLLEILTSEVETDFSVVAAAAEAIGYIGLPDDDGSYGSIGEMLYDEEFSWTALQLVLSLAKNANLHRGRAEDLMNVVDTVLQDACTSVSEVGADNQYLIGDCVEVLVRAAALCGRDAIGSLGHLRSWTTYVVDSDAVETLSERVGELRDLLSDDVARFLDDILARYGI